MTCDPKIRFTVEVIATAIPLASTIEVWLCMKNYDWTGKQSGYAYCPMVLRNVEDRLVVCCRVGIILILGVRNSRENVTYERTSVIFCDINALNDFRGISSILPGSFMKAGSHIRVLESVFEDDI